MQKSRRKLISTNIIFQGTIGKGENRNKWMLIEPNKDKTMCFIDAFVEYLKYDFSINILEEYILFER